MNKEQLRANKQTLKECKKWLETSKSDLRACKSLYKSQSYPQAVFDFQQSVEKSTKSLALFIGPIKSEELKKAFGHDTLKIYEGYLKDYTNKRCDFKRIMTANPQLNSVSILKEVNELETESEINELSKSISKLREKATEFGKTSEQIMAYIKKINKIFLQEENALKTLSGLKIGEKQFSDLKEKMLEITIQLERIKPDNTELKQAKAELEKLKPPYFEELMKNTFGYMIKTLMVYLASLYLTIITFRHISSTRYPDNKKNPDERYTEKSPLIKNLESLMELQDRTVSKIDKIFDGQIKLTSECIQREGR
jgi:HEPN domain-containing protein